MEPGDYSVDEKSRQVYLTDRVTNASSDDGANMG